MRKIAFKWLLFITANILLFFTHIYIFRTEIPFLVFVSIFIHVLALLFFPYFKLNQNKNQNETK